MRLESVEISNYRQYKDVFFDFCTKGSYDVHIIWGKNGMGKTNLLNAISWCLYGKEPHLSIKDRAKKKINTAVLMEAIDQKRDKCETKVSVKISVDNKQIIFEKRQEFKAVRDPFEYKPVFVVTVIAPTGNKVLTDTESIENLVRQYLPEDISEYFFFDNEQLDKYFISNQGEKIHQAIFNISQVNLLHSMSDRLSKVIHDYQNDAGSKNVGIKELNEKKKKAENAVVSLKDNISHCRQQSAQAEAEITRCNEYLAGKEGVPEKEKEYQELAAEIQSKEKELDGCMDECKKFLREYKILFSLYPRFRQTLELINSKERDGQLPPNIDPQFLKKMLVSHKCMICDREMGAEEEKNIERLLKQLNLSSSVSHLLVKIKSPLEDAVEKCRMYPERKRKLIHQELRITKELEVCREKLNKLDAYLKNYQDKDKIRELHEQRSKYTEIKKKNDENRIKFELQLNDAEKTLREINTQLQRAIENQAELKVLEKQIKFAQKARNTVREIEEEMMADTKSKMTGETMEIFQQLDWKTETFSHIELDDTYELELYDNYGYPMVGACSAAERALLALSFTLALQKVSGYDSMLFIDTPVGRVDSDNRLNFASVLKEVSKNKQVIITFSPSEYSQEIRDILEPCASTYKELKTTDESGIYIESR